MESVTLGALLKILAEFGTIGLIIYLWWADNRRIWAVMEQYQKDMAEQRKMYESNASLCRDFASIAKDLRDIVTLNVSTMTEVNDAVKQNQFCPLIRVDSKKSIMTVNTGREG